MVCTPDKTPLEKSGKPGRRYLFENWAKQLKGKTEIRQTLEDMVLPEHAKQRELHNILKVVEVYVKPNGKRVGANLDLTEREPMWAA